MMLKNKYRYLQLLIPFFLCSVNPAYGRTIHDIDVPEHVTQSASQQTLILNGAGIRSKFFISVYIGALYLPNKQTTVTAILQHNTPRRVMMYCLYHEIDKDKLVDAWNEGFDENNDEQTLKQLHDRLDEFNQLFPALHKGDIVNLDYVPDKGTTLSFNGKRLGNIPGEDFNTALLKVWLGKEPADSDLKEAMLGSE